MPQPQIIKYGQCSDLLKTELLMIVSLSIVLLFTTCGSIDFVFSSPSSSISPSSLALTTDSSINNNHQSLQLPPIANDGPNRVVTTGSTVILNGSNSRAPNGIILSYSWNTYRKCIFELTASTILYASALLRSVW